MMNAVLLSACSLGLVLVCICTQTQSLDLPHVQLVSTESDDIFFFQKNIVEAFMFA